MRQALVSEQEREVGLVLGERWWRRVRSQKTGERHWRAVGPAVSSEEA